MKRLVIAVAVAAANVASFATELPAADVDAEKLFAVKVLPLFKAKCFACHGDKADKIEGDFNMHTRAGLLAGGESEEASLAPGKPGESPLLAAVKWDDREMPPKENDRLDAEQIGWIEQWIAAGAPWPDEKTIAKHQADDAEAWTNADGIRVATSGGTSDEWTNRRYKPEDIWAFQPVVKADIPHRKNVSQQASQAELLCNVIDAFVEARLDREGLKPAPPADANTLLRRATYDLTGLPPTPKEQNDFLAAWEENPHQAWSDLIDRLLASKHYGERWGQHWLDVARYADTAGFSNDYERSNAWRYRDYVIRSINDDKPFDQFIVEQIAGDELVGPVGPTGPAARTDHDSKHNQPQVPASRRDLPELIVATGFLRMGPWGTAMVPKEQARQLYLDDVVDSIGRTFLSLPMRCCRCHDHKFDPIPTRDYYRIYAALAATQPAEVPADFLPQENRRAFESEKKLVDELLKLADDDRIRLVEKREAAAREWYKKHGGEYVDYDTRLKQPGDDKPPRHVGLDYTDEGTLKVREQDVRIWTRRQERFEPLAHSVYNGPLPKFLNSRKLRRPGKVDDKWRPENFVLGGGALEAPGEAVTPGVLSAPGIAIADSKEDPYATTSSLDGRRLELARWIAHPDNPLTARSLVNRVWQHHFGRGIVATPNNFGAKGDKPTHPELLDWLAADFVENGWKLKRLHKQIMLSQTYRQSTQHPQAERLAEIDPNDKLLARRLPRRLTAEELRDSLLLVSGELNRELGGLPARPEINLEVALQPRMIQFSIAPAYQPSPTPRERNRRSIYAYRVRGQANPFLEVLNLPNPNDSCEARETAATTPQAFTLMNSTAMTDRAIAFAQRLQKEADTPARQINRAFRLTYGRHPTKEQRQRLVQYVAKMTEHHDANPPEKAEYPTKITRSLVEEFSGKPFEYTEWLTVYNDYQADAKPWTVDAKTRALADVCLLLFNSNEFVYMY